MAAHIEMVTAKAQKASVALSRLMPNKGGPRSSVRKVLGSVAHSVMLYAAPIWQRAMDHNQSRKKQEQTQRRVALRVSSAYRTVSTEEALVISGTVPIKLQVEKRIAKRTGVLQEEEHYT
ncbi:uncharacterized protein LOC124355591 [Homalodisca vitripennis]|uniref:uncharacterized protein LOC124355591 n=1 Tax=Homalodisca vitripennis TaxID=197043 RepID=UPI001EEC3D01|nr:uncharacterized protein LOC124355591 [Homalodisca vitripennis]